MKSVALTSALLAVLGLSTAVTSELVKPDPVFKNVNLVHVISLEKNYVKESINVLVENVADNPQDTYYLPFTSNQSARVGGFEVRDRKDATTNPFEVHIPQIAPERSDVPFTATTHLEVAIRLLTLNDSDVVYYQIRLPQPLQPGARQTLGIIFYYLKAYTPQPSAIEQGDQQYLRYDFSAYCLAAYPTIKQKTEVKCQSAAIPNYSKISGSGDISEFPVRQGAKLTYGPFDEQPAGASLPLSVRFEFSKPVIHVSQLERDVEVSHWGGNVAFEERYTLHHRGANLSKLFDRVKWTQSLYNKPNNYALSQLKFPLKAGSVGAYFTDTIGNVTTSNFRESKRESLLEIKPRYPIFGGWKYPFTIGWNSDSKNFVRKTKTNGFVLSVPFIEGPKQTEGVEFETVTVRVFLPEGAENVKYYTTILESSIVDVSVGTHKTFLDTIGRTTVTFQARNLVDDFRDRELIISYDYTLLVHLHKPFIIFVSMFGVFAAAWIIGSVELRFVTTKRP